MWNQAWIHARACVFHSVLPVHYLVHLDSCALITRGPFWLQDNASRLKHETDDLKQQLLSEQVRHNRICIYMRLRWKIRYILSESLLMLLIVHNSQANVSELKQQMTNLHQQMMEKQVGKNWIIYVFARVNCRLDNHVIDVSFLRASFIRVTHVQSLLGV